MSINRDELNNRLKLLIESRERAFKVTQTENSSSNVKSKILSKTAKRKKKEIEKEEEEESSCCICYENSFKMKTNCNHYVCMTCILQLKNPSCPMCRTPFPLEIKQIIEKNTVAYVLQPMSAYGFQWSGSPMEL